MASQFPPKKGAAFTLDFTLYKNDGTVIANPGTITKRISKDEGNTADCTNSITEEDTTYGQCSLVLTATEMDADRVWIYIKDDTTGCVPFTCTIYTAGSLHDEVKSDTAAILADTGTDGVVVASGSKTGYSLTQAFPTNFAATAITAGGAVTAGTVSDKSGYSLTQTFPTNFASMVISAGGVVSANLTQILGTALTETAGYIAAAFKKFFNIADTNVPAATAITDIKTVTDRLGTTIVQDGAVWDFTAEALAAAPTGAGAAPVPYLPDTALVKNSSGTLTGTYSTLTAHDDVSINLTEHGTDGINLEVIRSVSTPGETPNLARINGYYNGATGHEVYIQAWNYALGTPAYETIGTMRSRSNAFDYVVPLSVDNHNASTGEMKLRFLHNTATYNITHDLYLDFVQWEKRTTEDALASDVAQILSLAIDIDAEVDELHTGLTTARMANLDNLDAAVSTVGGITQQNIDDIVDGVWDENLSTHNGPDEVPGETLWRMNSRIPEGIATESSAGAIETAVGVVDGNAQTAVFAATNAGQLVAFALGPSIITLTGLDLTDLENTMTVTVDRVLAEGAFFDACLFELNSAWNGPTFNPSPGIFRVTGSGGVNVVTKRDVIASPVSANTQGLAWCFCVNGPMEEGTQLTVTFTAGQLGAFPRSYVFTMPHAYANVGADDYFAPDINGNLRNNGVEIIMGSGGLPVDTTAIAEAVRDVNNDTPAANSLGADINTAAAGGGGGGTAATIVPVNVSTEQE